MSVLIKGMKMPKSCSVCRMLEGDTMDGLCHAAEKWMDDEDFWRWYSYPEGDIDDSKPSNCPLIEIPAEHGRLIDADALMENAQYKGKHDILTAYDVVAAPTIIQAEEEN